MRNTPPLILEQQIFDAILELLNNKVADRDEPLEYFADEILLRTMSNCSAYFLKQKGLRPSEKQALLALEKDIAETTDLSLIEQKLEENLAKIKPAWGELFGTHRGQVYNTFIAIKKWPCFTWHARLYYKEQWQKKRSKQLDHLSYLVSRQNEQLASASQLILQHETSSATLTRRAAKQFITIQKLRMEKSAPKKQAILATLPPQIEYTF